MFHAVVYPADISLDVTPDMESRVVIRTSKGATLTSQDYSSPRGSNGYYVVNAEWSPDSKFFVYSMSSSGGHSPWSFPMAVYGPEAAHGSRKDVIVGFSGLINGNPTVSADFKFTGPHTVVATTWKQPGSPEQVPVTVDLQQAFDNLPLEPPARLFLRYHYDVRIPVEKVPSSSIMMPQEVINQGDVTATSEDAMKSLVVKRSVVVAGHKTSVSLEDAFWKSLKQIAACGDMSVSALLAAIDSERRHGNLSSAIRLFVLNFYRDQFLDQLDVRDKPEAILALISRSAQKSSPSAPSE